MSQTTHADHDSVGDWVDYHGLESWILPLDSRKTNPLELIAEINQTLDELPKTQCTVTNKQLGWTDGEAVYKDGLKRLFLLRECNDIPSSVRFLNPEYMHYGHTLNPITDEAERLAFYERFKDSPTVTGAWFANHFGHSSEDSFTKWACRRDLGFGEQINQNKRRFGRTLYTILQWTDYTYRDLFEIIPQTPGKTESQILSYGKHADDWTPPEIPTDEPWYSRDVKRAQGML